jgi:hypothetical protein
MVNSCFLLGYFFRKNSLGSCDSWLEGGGGRGAYLATQLTGKSASAALNMRLQLSPALERQVRTVGTAETRMAFRGFLQQLENSSTKIHFPCI